MFVAALAGVGARKVRKQGKVKTRAVEKFRSAFLLCSVSISEKFHGLELYLIATMSCLFRIDFRHMMSQRPVYVKKMSRVLVPALLFYSGLFRIQHSIECKQNPELCIHPALFSLDTKQTEEHLQHA